MKNKELKFLFGPKGIILSIIALAAVIAAAYAVSLTSKTYGHAQEYGKSVVRTSSGSQSESNEEPVMSYRELSASYRRLEATCVEWTDRGNVEEGTETGLYFISEENLTYCVYDTDSEALCEDNYKLSDFDYMWLNSEDDGFYVLINLAGKNIDLSGYYILARTEGSVYASRVLINCYEAETVSLENAIVNGTVLAPYASVNVDNAYIYGQVLSDSTAGTTAAYKEIRFTGYTPLTDSLRVVTFQNDCVRAAAVNYLLEHDDVGLYKGYTADSQLKLRDLVAVKELDLSGQSVDSSTINQDLARLTGLEVLKLSGSDIKALSLSAHAYLTELEANETPLVSLTLTGAPALMKLSLENTALTELDLSACTQLRIVSLRGTKTGWAINSMQAYLKYLDCSDTGIDRSLVNGDYMPLLETLNISENPDLLGLELPTFTVLTALDCSGTGLTDLKVGEDCKLTYLRANNTKISTLDLRALKHLYVCECYGEGTQTILANRYADALYTDAEVIISQADEEPVQTEETADQTAEQTAETGEEVSQTVESDPWAGEEG